MRFRSFIVMVCAAVMTTGWCEAHAEASATATASAVILGAGGIALTPGADLSFGEIHPQSSQYYWFIRTASVTISTKGEVTNTQNCEVLDEAKVSAGHFTFIGDLRHTPTVGISPKTLYLQNQNDPDETISISSFKSTVSKVAGSNDTYDIAIGGTLSLKTNQATGMYTGTYSITVNYW